MNTRSILSAALAVGVLFAPALVQAQAPVATDPQKLEAKVKSLQGQVSALQAQVDQLHAQLRATELSAAVRRTYTIPQYPFRQYSFPTIQGLGGIQGPHIYLAPVPQRYWNIPPCQITFIKQAR